MIRPADKEQVSIVVLGNFNPAIFHPSWFEHHELIRQKEAETAEIERIHPSASIFTAEWLNVHVVQEKFQIMTTYSSYYETLRDLALSVFKLLEHTPIYAMGLNRQLHYRMETEKSWHKVGDCLVPKEPWNEILDSPGMRSVLLEGKRPDEYRGYIHVRVEPSSEVQYGIYINVNDHYQLSNSNRCEFLAEQVCEILSDQWQTSMVRSLKISQKVTALGD